MIFIFLYKERMAIKQCCGSGSAWIQTFSPFSLFHIYIFGLKIVIFGLMIVIFGLMRGIFGQQISTVLIQYCICSKYTYFLPTNTFIWSKYTYFYLQIRIFGLKLHIFGLKINIFGLKICTGCTRY